MFAQPNILVLASRPKTPGQYSSSRSVACFQTKNAALCILFFFFLREYISLYVGVTDYPAIAS